MQSPTTRTDLVSIPCTSQAEMQRGSEQEERGPGYRADPAKLISGRSCQLAIDRSFPSRQQARNSV